MASTSFRLQQSDEVEDLITCPICLSEYEEAIENRKPKFLPCSHTVCLQCLKEIEKGHKVKCPLCRKLICLEVDVNHIPNNTYALCMLKIRAQLLNSIGLQTKPKIPKMLCLTCGSIGKIDCPTQHSTVVINENTLSNFETLISLMDQCTKIRTKVESTIENQKNLQSYVAQVLKALKSFEQEVKALSEESDLRLAELSSLLEMSPLFANNIASNKEEGISAFLSHQLFSLINPSKSNENLDTLNQKMTAYFEELEVKMKSCSDENPLCQLVESVNKTKFAVEMSGEGNSNTTSLNLEEGYTPKWKEWNTSSIHNNVSEDQRNLLLLSHLILYVEQRHKEQQITPPLPLNPQHSEDLARSSTTFVSNWPPLPGIGKSTRPALHQIQGNISLIVIVSYRDGIYDNQIHIQPSSSMGPSVIYELLAPNFRLGTAKASKSIEMPSLVVIPLIDNDPLPWYNTDLQSSLEVRSADVYLMNVKAAGSNQPSKWALGFGCGNGAQSRKLENVRAVLLGRIVNGLDAIEILSGLNVPNLSRYTFRV